MAERNEWAEAMNGQADPAGWVVVRKVKAGQVVYEPCRNIGRYMETLGLHLTEEEAWKVVRMHKRRAADAAGD